MRKGRLKYLALWGFLAGVVLIVFLQFLSSNNINRLIQNNKKLLREVKVQNSLRQLQTDLLALESDIRGFIITNKQDQVPQIAGRIQKITGEMQRLKVGLDTGKTRSEMIRLDFLVQEKLNFSKHILQTFDANLHPARENLINTVRSKEIRDSIITIVSRLDNIRQGQLKGTVGSIENNGNRATAWGLILAAIACIACVLTFLYVVNLGRHQQQMISKLNESEQQLKVASMAKEQFLANMSHEIRTPMNAILGFTNLLKKTGLEQQQAQYVDFISSSGENLLSLINDILDLSKIEAGMMQVENAPFSINGLVSSIEIMFAEKAKAKGLQFSVSVDPSIHDTLSGDAIRLTQILINLLSNAIKFTEKGLVQLSVHPVKTTQDETVLQFRVKDSGIGIAPENREHIFERFQQAEAATTRRFGGTGLGLSIVKQLVTLQKGNIAVNSELGKGTEFVVTLPFAIVKEYSEAHAILPHEISLTVKNVRLLIAEDNQMNQHLIRHLMKQWQLDFTLVSNGREVLEQLRKQSFSLILMDIQMPEMDGYLTTTAIRSELKLEVPIVAMTAHAMAGEKERCLSFGMNGYISKPIKESELYQIIQQYTENNEMTSQASDAKKIVCLDYLRELSMGDAEFEQAIMRQFVVQIPEELELLKEAIQVRNKQQIKSIAHGLKSSVAYVGLNDTLHPHLHRMESEAVLDVPDNHFEEDCKRVEEVCSLAVAETQQLLAHSN